MKNDRDTALQRAAESVADGVPFAWEQESEGQGEVKEKLRRLQVLDLGTAQHHIGGAKERRQRTLRVTRFELRPAEHVIGMKSVGGSALADDGVVLGRLAIVAIGEQHLAASES